MHSDEPFQFVNTHFLTNSSKEKLHQLKLKIDNQTYYCSNLYLKNLSENMLASFVKEINIEPINPLNIDIFHDILIDFNRRLNCKETTKFENDVLKMNIVYSFSLSIPHGIIRIHFLTDYKKNIGYTGYISSLLHALHTFCNLFTYDYNGLEIYVCMDDNVRNIELPNNYNGYHDIFNYLCKISAAFNVSGVTWRHEKKIILTKNEELIKLLYHEMIHFIGLDSELFNVKNYYDWSITKNMMNLYESYTEFISVILNSIYISIHLSYLKNMDMSKIYKKILYLELNYSLYLTANILKFYGYNFKTFKDFFSGRGEKKFCPVLIWEYVIIRTQLFLNIDKVLDLVGPSTFIIDQNNKNIKKLII